jgi:hypothetical protein
MNALVILALVGVFLVLGLRRRPPIDNRNVGPDRGVVLVLPAALAACALMANWLLRGT